MSDGDPPRLARELGPLDATMIVLSGIIGSGIFINPAIVAQKVGTPLLIMLVWLAGGLIALCGAFVFAELATVLPRAGGQYAYFREAFHPLFGFLHGTVLNSFVVDTRNALMACAILAVGVPAYFVRLWLSASRRPF